MHSRVGVLVCIGLALGAAAASADTYYKYRDKNTRRDVFVNRLDQVPRKVRGQAKIVLETDTPTAEPAPEPPIEIVEPPAKTDRLTIRNAQPAPPSGEDLRSALADKNLWRDGPALASAAVDAKLVTAGAPPSRARSAEISAACSSPSWWHPSWRVWPPLRPGS